MGSAGLKAADLLVGRASPSTNKLEGEFQNGTCLYQCPCDRTSSQNWLLPVSVSPECTPASCPPRSACGSDPGSFQITASALGPGAGETLCVPCKSGVSVFHSLLALPKVSPAGLQSQTFWGLIYLVQ